jgi:hypothetical protein
MLSKIRSILISPLIVLMLLQGPSPLVWAQAAAPAPEQLDQLLAPVALYPDALLSQITTASTNPQEILDVNAWLQANPGLTGAAVTDAAEKQGFDPAFIALVNFPTVVSMMADHIDDYAAIGQAFSADQDAVTASIQRLRAQAYDSGALRSSGQQRVEVQQQPAGQTIYVIQPANPQVVYVPQYDPTVVYVRPASGVIVATPRISFSVGIGIGALLVDDQPWGWGGWGWNWGARRAYYNHGYWSGWRNPYRPLHRWYRARPIVWANRPGYRGNWGYRPPHYRPPSPPVVKPGHPGNRPIGRRPPPAKPTTPEKPVWPNPTKPIPDRPSRPSGKPGTPSRPDQGQPRQGQPIPPNGTDPDRPNRPSGPPAKPGTPSRPDQGQPRTGQPTAPGQNQPAPKQPPAPQFGKPGAPSQPKSMPMSRPQNRKPALQPKPEAPPETPQTS